MSGPFGPLVEWGKIEKVHFTAVIVLSYMKIHSNSTPINARS